MKGSPSQRVATAPVAAVATLVLAFPISAALAAEPDLFDEASVTSTTVNVRSGVATVSGVIDCLAPADGGSLWITLSQSQGRNATISHQAGSSRFICQGSGPLSFNLDVDPPGGNFRPGSATLTYSVGQCVFVSNDPPQVSCDTFGDVTIRVRLTPR